MTSSIFEKNNGLSWQIGSCSHGPWRVCSVGIGKDHGECDG